MVHSVVESTAKLWNPWNIRALVILSLLLQVFLCLFSPWRKQRGGKWVVIIWLAYLLADWVPRFTIGLILQAESSQILVLWATFLLLHLGGPDTITSFSLEDNELWIRYALGFMLQFGSILYLFIHLGRDQKSQSVVSFLVFILGIAKCGERIYTLYLSSFDHYGELKVLTLGRSIEATDNGSESSCNYSLKQELSPYGTIKNLLVGPLLSPGRRKFIREAFFQKEAKDVLLMLENELSLLYEALHTKFQFSYLGSSLFISVRIVYFIWIFLAFSIFPSTTELSHLGMFEIWVTYGLLIGAMTMDFISIGFFLLSDFKILSSSAVTGVWMLSVPNVIPMSWKLKRGKGCRWSKTIPQCNLITYNDYLTWLDFPGIQTILEAIRGIQCSSSQNLREDTEWSFIFEEVLEKAGKAETVEMGKDICLKRGNGILDTHEECRHLSWSVKELDYTKSLITWHLATEACFQNGDQRSTSASMDHRGISKLISDYMFFLLQMEPTMMTTVSSDWKAVRREARRELRVLKSYLTVRGETDLAGAIFSLSPDTVYYKNLPKKSVLVFANKLANQLNGPDGLPWRLMSQVWVEIMCYAAINCRPNVHAQQPSKGGQLLTFVWLLMNHFGLGTQFSAE